MNDLEEFESRPPTERRPPSPRKGERGKRDDLSRSSGKLQACDRRKRCGSDWLSSLVLRNEIK